VHVWLGGIGGGCLSWSTSEYPLSLLTDDELYTIKQSLFIMFKVRVCRLHLSRGHSIA
jgi:hypothetical protein